MTTRERRRSDRVPVGIDLDEIVDEVAHRCHATSLSGCGLYIERRIERFRRHNNRVQLVLPLPDGAEGLWAQAEVVYDCFRAPEEPGSLVRTAGLLHGTALRFTYIPDRDRARLRAFLECVRGGDAGARPGHGKVEVVRPARRAGDPGFH